MESRFHGAPISTTAPMTPKTAPFQNITSGIRAPLTIDESDFEYSPRNSITSSYCSGSELDFDGSVSGEDEFETASQNPIDETVKRYSFSRPLVKNPNGDVVLGSSKSSSYESPRAYLKNPGREIAQESGNVLVNVISRPYGSKDDDLVSLASDSSEEIDMVDDSVEKYDDSRNLVAVSKKVVLEKMPSVRMIQMSGYSDDDDSQGSEVSEDDAFSGVARVPEIELPQSINCAPKVRISDIDDDADENEVEADNMVFFEVLAVNSDGLAFEGENEMTGVGESIDGDATDQDKGSDVDNEVRAIPVLSNEVGKIGSTPKVSILEFRDSEDSETEAEDKEFGGDFIVGNGVPGVNTEEMRIGVADNTHGAGVAHSDDLDVRKELETSSFLNEHNSLSESESNEDLTHVNVVDDGLACVDLTIHREPTDMNEVSDSLGEIPPVVSSTELGHPFESFELKGNQAAEFGSSSICLAVSLNDSDREITDKLENGTKQNIEPKVEFSTSFTFSKTELFSEHTEALMNTERVGMSNGSLDMDSLIDISNFDGSVLLCSELDQEIDDEAEINERLQSDAGSVMSHTDTMSMIAVIEREEAVSDGESQNQEDVSLGTNGQETIDSSISNSNADQYVSLDGFEKVSLEKDYSDLESISATELRKSGICASFTHNGEIHEAPSGENQIRGKYLWLPHRLHHYPEDSTEKAAMDLEVQSGDSTLRILVIGKNGVGKSATINSILGELKMEVDAFGPKTKHVKETVASLNGFKVNIFDTPGLRTSLADLSFNQRVLLSIKKLIKKSPPDVVLYVDRLDTPSNDLPLLKLVTAYLGSSIWSKSVLVLTHADSMCRDELFVAQRSQALQKLISLSTLGMFDSLIPISLVENNCHLGNKHEGSWRSQMLNLCYSIKASSKENDAVGRHMNVCEWDLQSQCCEGVSLKVKIGEGSKIKISGRIYVKTSACNQLHIALLTLLPIAKAIFLNISAAGQ